MTKRNNETCLLGGVGDGQVILAPYRSEHVPNYHEWMKDPDLLEATGSEPLSYDQEIQMQQSWRDDENKCTFIVHAPVDDCSFRYIDIDIDDNYSGSDSDHDDNNNNGERESQVKVFHVEDNLSTMIGDVNLFLSEIDDDNDDNNNESDINEKQRVQLELLESASNTAVRQKKKRIQAEIDIMIAEKEYRRKGLGYSATLFMLLYGARELNIQRFFCKINEDNISSIRLFQRLGFIQCNYASCFRQIEFELYKSASVDMDLFLQDKIGGCYGTITCGLSEVEKRKLFK
mmetsp:Transcript_8212/g.9560  ORF Transcript_8212/g.9560 Transcript_8212/m.9560 type:complete len:288 (+) Transcript_8212:2-865(+)